MTEFENNNEELIDEDIESDEDIEDDNINEPFDPTQIRVDTRAMTIDLVMERIRYDELDLTPDFQRQAGIWTEAAQSRLIESILIRIPLPAFYMDATNDDKWLVVDGLQRLTALKKFIIDKKLKLKGLEYLTDIEGKSYEGLPRNYQRRIRETQVTVYVIEKGTPEAVKFNIYKRINTGGLPLSLQEMRHALNQGKATQILASLADSSDFKKVAGIKDWQKKRMGDREFVLRCLAFMITSYTDYNAKSMDEFLNQSMKKMNKMTARELDKLEQNFTKAMQAAFELFGSSAFRKPTVTVVGERSRRTTVNKALFDSWSVNLSKLDKQEIEILKERKEVLIKKFTELIVNDKNFNYSISQGTGKVTYVKERFSKIEKLIEEVLM